MTPSSTFNFATVVTVATLILVTPVSALAKRVALVIGNAAYENASPLANPRNDAMAISTKLQTLGFEIIEGYDLGFHDMSLLLRDFARTSRGAELSVVFYAGHGMAVNGENYLVPVDAIMEEESAIGWELIPMSMITNQFNNDEGAHLLLLDACRDNPLAGKLASATGDATRSATNAGLAMVNVPASGKGTGIAFATAPGAVARDGDGAHSPFTEALLSHLGASNVAVSSIMNRVNADVREATGDDQIPWFNSSFTGDVFLNEVQEVAAVAAPALQNTQPVINDGGALTAAAFEAEKEFWAVAKENNSSDYYQLYIDQFPNGRFVPLARMAIADLKEQVASQSGDATRAATHTDAPIEVPAGPLVLAPTPYMQRQTGQRTDRSPASDRQRGAKAGKSEHPSPLESDRLRRRQRGWNHRKWHPRHDPPMARRKRFAADRVLQRIAVATALQPIRSWLRCNSCDGPLGPGTGRDPAHFNPDPTTPHQQHNRSDRRCSQQLFSWRWHGTGPQALGARPSRA